MAQRMIEVTTFNNPIQLAPNLQLDANELVGKQIAVFGMPGYGKTNAIALLCEQLAQYIMPMAIFDKEGDFKSLIKVFPRGILATAANCPSGHDILRQGLQVVYDLSSWRTDHDRAQIIITIVNQLMLESSASTKRVPCVVVLDEAQHWLPQRTGSHLDKEVFTTLSTAFEDLGSTGRKRGFTPFYACPKISELSKSVLYPGMYMFFRATLHTDVNRYLYYLQASKLTKDELKHYIETLPVGTAMMKLPNGRQRTISLDKRVSEHTSHTPTVQASLNAYASMAFDPDEQFGPKGLDAVSQLVSDPTFYEDRGPVWRCKQLLAADGTLTTRQLLKLAKCSTGVANDTRKDFLQQK